MQVPSRDCDTEAARLLHLGVSLPQQLASILDSHSQGSSAWKPQHVALHLLGWIQLASERQILHTTRLVSRI
jgi:hypothetical protein